MWNVNIEICNNVMYYYNFCAIRMTLNQITSVMVFVIVDSVVVVTWWLDSFRSVTTVSAVSVTTTSGGGFGCDLRMLFVNVEYYMILKNSSSKNGFKVVKITQDLTYMVWSLTLSTVMSALISDTVDIVVSFNIPGANSCPSPFTVVLLWGGDFDPSQINKTSSYGQIQ